MSTSVLTEIRDEEDGSITCCIPICALNRPVQVGNENGHCSLLDDNPFWIWPCFGPLLFENQTSDARDHCANERTFLSYLRLSIYMAIVSVAIVLSFHLKNKPSAAELTMAKPLGLIFWVLSLACLLVGLGNYITTINQYSRKVAIVQTGLKTQIVMSVVSLSIIGTCITLLVINRMSIDFETA